MGLGRFELPTYGSLISVKLSVKVSYKTAALTRLSYKPCEALSNKIFMVFAALDYGIV